MSYLNQKTLNIVLEEFTDFGFRLTFKEKSEECTPHPVTGEPTNCKEVASVLPVDGLQFTGSIKETLADDAPILAQFIFSMVAAADGIVEMTLSQETVDALAQGRPGNLGSTRQRQIGFYDVITYDPVGGVTTRIMQGTVYVSDGVTE